MEEIGAQGSTFMSLALIFLIIMATLWFLLPFAVFGIKDKLNEIISISKNSSNNLELLLIEIRSLRKAIEKDYQSSESAIEKHDN